MKTFAKALEADRRALAIRQKTLAEMVGVSQQAIARWENGQSAPRVEPYKRLVKVLERECAGKGIESEVAKAKRPLSPNLEAVLEDALIDIAEGVPRVDWKGNPANPEAIRRVLEHVKRNKDKWRREEKKLALTAQVAGLAERWAEIPELRNHIVEVFGNELDEDTITQVIEHREYDENWLENWLKKMEPVLRDYLASRRFLSLAQRRQRDAELLREHLPAPLWTSINVSVERGISKRVIDYFSNQVVAEIKVLNPFRPPVFSINAYASEVVDLLLAKTMAFGHDKEYLLLLIHDDVSQHDDLSYRMMSMQADCSALGIRALLVKSYKQAAFLIRGLEDPKFDLNPGSSAAFL
jgi:transcriptional regulator with XRE-family HTH domain